MTLFIFFVALGLYVVPRYTGLVTSRYTSDEFGITFGHSTNYLVTERADSDIIEIKKADKPDEHVSLFIEKHRKPAGDRLSFRISREFGENMYNDRSQSTEKLDGVFFNWEGERGDEIAFGFESLLYDYILSTYGMPEDEGRLQFEKIMRSMSILED